MPEILRSGTLSIAQEIALPMSPPIVIVGRGMDGKAVCQLHINATGVVIAGPRGAALCNLNWEQLVELAEG